MEFRGVRRRGSVRSARVLDPRRWFAALNRKLRPRHNPTEAWRARLAELTASWGEPAREWSATPVDTEEPLSYVRLGGPALPLIRRFVEPALQVEVHGDIVVARFQTGDRDYAAALWQAQIVAVRCWYRGADTEPALREQEAVELLEDPDAHQFRAYDRGWRLALPDCPARCLVALDQL